MSARPPLLGGRAFFCGDFVDTDVMAPGRFEPYADAEQLARAALIDYPSDVPFIEPGSSRSNYGVIVAGEEFGCGSSRETAPMALAYAGVEVIVARSFARIFFRNCINMGLILPVHFEHSLDASILGAEVWVDLDACWFEVAGQRHTLPDYGPLSQIYRAGGLTAYNKARRGH
ncbi:MAG: 3-isopropylmalate dehydratase [Nannocystaceae bacterium]